MLLPSFQPSRRPATGCSARWRAKQGGGGRGIKGGADLMLMLFCRSFKEQHKIMNVRMS